MKILVTGGSGFIGSHFVDCAISSGSTVLNIDKLTYAGSLENNKDVSESPNYFFECVDITCEEQIMSLTNDFRPDAIVHFAAESHVDNSISDASNFIHTNVYGTYSLLETTKNYLRKNELDNFKFIHVSTDEVFGTLGSDGEFSEESPYRPNSPYSASKASSDMLVRAWYETFNLPTIITNCSNNYGPRQHGEKLIPVVVDACKNRRKIPVYGDGTNIRDWLYVGDHVAALWKVLHEGVVGERYCIGGSNELSNISIVSTICDLFKNILDDDYEYKELIKFTTDRRGHDYRYAIDNKKIMDMLGWQPSSNFETTLIKTIKSYL